MKIAFVRKSYNPYGGAEKYLSQLTARLIKMGHEVHIFAHRWDSIAAGKADGPSPSFHKVPVIPNPSFLEALSFAFFSRRLLQEESFTIIHSFERTLFQDIYRAGDGCHREWLIRREKMDSWMKRAFHPINPLHRSLLFLERNLFRSPRLKRIMPNAHRGKEEIMRHYGVPEERIEVIHNGVDSEAFHPRNREAFRLEVRRDLGIAPGAFVMLFLGSGFRRKGLDGVIAALAEVRKAIPQGVLLVAGKDRVEGYRAHASRAGVGDAVLFLGPTGKARELYAASDLFVLPTFYDPFSNACLEAMASGLPVLTTPYNGIAEFIQEGRNGFLVEPSMDGAETASKMVRFYRDFQGKSMGEEARKSILPLDMSFVIPRILQLYEKVQKD